MAITDDYRRQHEEILELAGRLSGCLHEQELKDNAQEARNVLSKLSGALKVHLAMEDNSLYPRLLASPDEKVRETAKQFIEEMGGIATAFNDYLKKWTVPAAIRSNPSQFMAETGEILTALRNRIVKENDVLYPIIDRA